MAEPLNRDHTDPSPGPGPSNVVALPGTRVPMPALNVLIVDDDYEDFVLAKKNLQMAREAHYEVTYANNAAGGYELLTHSRFDVALIDYRLGRENGLDLVRRLGGRAAATPLILLTGGSDQEADLSALEAGVIDYLDKRDMNPESLTRTIRFVRHTHALERRLQSTMARLSAASQAKTDFLARMSHEIRTPLNAIIGFSEIMKEQMLGPVGTPAYAEYAANVHDSASHLLHLINDILDLSKIESGQYDLQVEEIDVDRELRSVVRFVMRQAQAKQLALTVQAGHGLPKLPADLTALRQMVLNLLSNAVKFTPERGAVTLSAICIGHEFRITVDDTGVGIPEDRLEQAFEPFARADDPFVRAQEGTGLGLPIVKSLIEMHNGRLELKSRPGRGTSASLVFSLQPPKRVASA